MDTEKIEEVGGNIDDTLHAEEKTGKKGYVALKAEDVLAGRYKITSKLGEGGMGAVYSGFDSQLQQNVAIKILKRELSSDPKAVDQLKQEAQVAMLLTHPRIMRLINFERHGDNAFLLMEYVEGKTLEAAAGKQPNKKFPPKAVALIGYKVCEALEYAHQKNVVHRDIKPANIMISGNLEMVKLMDFGIAKVLAPGSGERQPIMGTLPYIAPEIFDYRPPDARADIYALGLTLYVMLSGKHPFGSARTAKEIIKLHCEMTPEPVPGVDKALNSIIAQCIEKKPNARYQSAKELKMAFAKYLDIDDTAKITRMKKQVEQEAERMETERKRISREKEKLATKMKNMETEASRKHTSAAFRAMGAARHKDQDGSPMLTISAALVSGIGGAIIASMIKSGDIGRFATAAQYAMASYLTLLVAIVAFPAFLRYGFLRGLFGIFTGCLLGYVSFLFDDAMTAHDISNSPFSRAMAFLSVAVPMSAGVVFINAITRTVSDSVKLFGVAVVACVVVSLLPYLNIASVSMKIMEENAGYVYFPVIAAIVWGLVDYWESR